MTHSFTICALRTSSTDDLL